ncbi:MAG: CHC2 zinc finger domain-containing protein, partial [Kiritimatiellaeota bacterium]|nr:CHC2 zinc finger domain-containing protein [Kiritimatiellota bacterium]
MPRTLEEIKDDIKNRLSIVEVVGSRIQLKHAGSAYKACCPFHHEKTPSFTVNPSTGFYKCFGCGEAGDIFSFLMKNDGMSFMDALRALAERAGVEVDLAGGRGGDGASAKRLFALHTEIASFYRRCLLEMKSAAPARAYLKSRALSEEICEAFGVGYAPVKTGLLEAFALKHKFALDEMIRGGFG